MAEKLILRLSQPPSNDIEWLICDENHFIVEGPHRSSLHEATKEPLSVIASAAKRAKKLPTVVLVPTVAFQITKTFIPRTSRANLLKAIPFALSDQIASNDPKLHYAILKNVDNTQHLAIVSPSQMDAWIKPLHEAGFDLEAMIPDVYALPETHSTWTLFCEKEIVLCSAGESLKFSCDKKNAVEILKLFLKKGKHEKPSQLALIGCDLSQLGAPLGTEKIDDIPCQHYPKPSSPLAYFVNYLPKCNTINLLQGEYQPVQAKSLIKRTWQFAMLAVGLWFLTSLMADIIHVRKLTTVDNQLKQKITNLAQTIFSTAVPTDDLRTRIKNEISRLQAMNQGNLALILLSQSAPIIKSFQQISIEGLEFKDKQLTLNVRTHHFQDIENFVIALKAKNILVEQQNAERNDGEVRSHIVLMPSLASGRENVFGITRQNYLNDTY